jgi:enamine deaminase RidA (YjgF/YER057c/UK114 family)
MAHDQPTRAPGRQLISSGSKYERSFGYSRAVRVGNVVHVAGTTGIGPDGKVVAKNDAFAQAKRALEIIEHALQEAGSSFRDVVRTRVYITRRSHGQDVMRAHGEAFADIRPAASLITVKGFIDADMLVEIEAYAVIPSSEGDVPPPSIPEQAFD